MSHQAKLDRARKHLDAVHATIEEHRKLDPYRLTPDDEHREVIGDQIVQHFIRGYIDPPLPVEQIGLEVGDCVHNMRSALDHLAYALAGGTGVDDSRVQFPIFMDETEYKKGLWRLKGVPPAAIAIMERLQPYKTGNADAVKIHLLAMLATLDNIDKHRRPLVSASAASLVAFASQGSGAQIRVFGQQKVLFENGTVITTAEVRLGYIGAHVNMAFEASFGVAFAEEAPLLGMGVHAQLKEIHRYIGEDIFPLFKDFLPP